MTAMTGGVTKAGTGIDGIVWNILGQTYVPKHLTESSFSWHATFPPGTFVPPHIHPTQDEFIYMLEGRMDLVLEGRDFVATAGDVIRLPMGIPHGLFNKSDQIDQMPVLGVAEPQAVRPVLGHPQHERAEPARRRGAFGEIRNHVPAAAGLRLPLSKPPVGETRHLDARLEFPRKTAGLRHRDPRRQSELIVHR